MKKELLSLMTLAACSLGMNAETLLVHDGGGSNAYTPISSTYCDEVGTIGQVLYPAEELADMNGKQITSVKFFFDTDGAKFTGGKYEVSVAETNANPYSVTTNAPVAFEGAQVVATIDGPASGDAELVINFDTPYTYNGGMLMIQTKVTEAGAYRTSYFVGETTTTYQSLGKSWSYSAQRFLPKTEFTYTAGENPQPAEPEFVFTPAAGTYTAAQNVAVTVNNKPENCFMQVKFVGDTEIDWMRAESYNVTESGELYARLVSSEDYETVIATSAAQTYVINIPEPVKITFNPAAGEVEAGTQVTVTAANVPAGMKLFARQDRGSWNKYITTFTINAESTIQAAVLDENTAEEDILWYMIDDEMKAEANYTIVTTPVVEPKIVFNPEAGEYEAGTQVTVSAEGIDYDYIIKATYGDIEKEGTTVTFELTESNNILATVWKWSDSMDDYVQTSVQGTAHYTVIAPEPEPVITITPDGGNFTEAQVVTVTVENKPADADVVYEYVPDEGETTGEMGYYAPITVDKTGTLYVKVVREAADPTEGAPARVKTGVLAQKQASFIIDIASSIEALTAGKAVKSVSYINVAGQKAAQAFQGVNIVVVEYQDGTQAVAKVVK